MAHHSRDSFSYIAAYETMWQSVWNSIWTSFLKGICEEQPSAPSGWELGWHQPGQGPGLGPVSAPTCQLCTPVKSTKLLTEPESAHTALSVMQLGRRQRRKKKRDTTGIWPFYSPRQLSQVSHQNVELLSSSWFFFLLSALHSLYLRYSIYSSTCMVSYNDCVLIVCVKTYSGHTGDTCRLNYLIITWISHVQTDFRVLLLPWRQKCCFCILACARSASSIQSGNRWQSKNLAEWFSSKCFPKCFI